MKYKYEVNMEITIQHQCAYDFDWFAVDNDGWIAHFTSGATRLPGSVAVSLEDNKLLLDFFKQLPFICKPFEDTDDSDSESCCWYCMACRGLASYDISDECVGDSLFEYHRMYSPEKPLNISDVPDEIAVILKRTVLKNETFAIKSMIYFNDID
ncbi:MAG: hypothetical protein JEZ07_09960 [Phycisphaerae bacterium]|nr:hypothetical protein [Phycisphaerae bacterium]